MVHSVKKYGIQIKCYTQQVSTQQTIRHFCQ